MQKRLINVCDIGADPSGLHDSTKAFRDALANTTGQGVLVPNGTYSLSGLIKDYVPSLASLSIGSGEGPGDEISHGVDVMARSQGVPLRKKGGK